MPLAHAATARSLPAAATMILSPINNKKKDELSISSTIPPISWGRNFALLAKSFRVQHSAATRVQFDESHNRTIDNHQVRKEDTPKLWYSALDYKIFKANHMQAAKDMIHIKLEQEKKSDDPPSSSASYLHVMDKVFDECCNQSASEDDSRVDLVLQELARSSLQRVLTPDRVGLERLTVRNSRVDKKARRSELVETFLELQYDHYYSPVDERGARIAKAAQTLSRPSRAVAYHLAAAHSRHSESSLL